MDSRPTTRGTSWCEPFTGWERSAASLGSLDSAAPLSSTAVTSVDNKRRQNHPVFNFSSEVYENSKGMTLSDDSLHPKQQHNTTGQEPRHQLKAKTLPAPGLSRDKKGRVHSQELLSTNSSVSSDLRKSLIRPVACLLVLGGKTRTQADMGRSLDIWRCDIDPGMVLLVNESLSRAHNGRTLQGPHYLSTLSMGFCGCLSPRPLLFSPGSQIFSTEPQVIQAHVLIT